MAAKLGCRRRIPMGRIAGVGPAFVPDYQSHIRKRAAHKDLVSRSGKPAGAVGILGLPDVSQHALHTAHQLTDITVDYHPTARRWPKDLPGDSVTERCGALELTKTYQNSSQSRMHGVSPPAA
jgi:hypothetical protein